MKTRFSVLSVLIAGTTAILSACGGIAGDKEGAKGPDEARQREPVTLTFFESSSGRSVEWFMDLYGNDIKKKFPHLKLEFKFVQKVNDKSVGLPEMIASGDAGIDIIISSVGSLIPTLIDNGLQYDHSELIKKTKYDLSKLDQTPVQLLQELSGGGLYGLPVTATANALVFNRDLFDKFGVSYPKDGMTWDEIYETAKKMTRKEDNVSYRGFVASHSHVALVNQLSASYVDPKTHKALFSSDARWAKHAQNMRRFHEIPGNEVDGKSVGAAHAQFTVEKTAAMYVNSLDATFLNPSTFGINIDAVQLPEYSDLKGVGSQLYPTYLSVVNSSKNKDAAFEVIAWMTSEEYQLERAKRGFTPVVKSEKVRSALGQDLPYLQGRNAKAFIPAKPAAPSKLTEYNTMANTEFLLQLRKYVIGEIDLNTMLRQTDEIVNNKITEAKAKASK